MYCTVTYFINSKITNYGHDPQHNNFGLSRLVKIIRFDSPYFADDILRGVSNLVVS